MYIYILFFDSVTIEGDVRPIFKIDYFDVDTFVYYSCSKLISYPAKLPPKAGVIMIADDFFEQMVEMTELRHLGAVGVSPSFMWSMSKVSVRCGCLKKHVCKCVCVANNKTCSYYLVCVCVQEL